MKLDFFINGRFEHRTATTYTVLRKGDLTPFMTVPDAQAEDVNAAVEAAAASQPAWRDMPVDDKMVLLLRLADGMRRRAAEFGDLHGPEVGVSRRGSAEGMKGHAALVRYYAGLAGKTYGAVLAAEDGFLNYTVEEPLGVIATMLPWNSTIGAFTQKVPAALMMGNTVVVRAADEAPLSTLLMGEVLAEAGFPAGVVNIICGLGPTSGEALVSHPLVRAVSFTGSVPTGKAIVRAAAASLKRTVLELGGKTPFIVFPDADLQRAAETAVQFAYNYQGQICCSVARILVHREIASDFISRLLVLIAKFRPALPDDDLEPPVFGPLFNEKQFQRTCHFLEVARNDGQLLCGGERLTDGRFASGYYVRPALAKLQNTSSELWEEEIFGPLATVTEFSDDDEALALANHSRFALAASVWSRDLGRLHRLCRRISAGTVWANSCFQFSHHSPWGGFKESGWGREYGAHAIRGLSDTKNVWLVG